MSHSLSLNRSAFLCKPEDGISAPLLFDSPHSGTHIPNDMPLACSHDHVKSVADLYVNNLFDHVTEQGMAFLKTDISRCYVDVNRHIDDIDIHMVDGLWSAPIYTKGRAKHGYGVIYRTARGERLTEAKFTAEQIKQRLAQYYTPYHDILKETLDSLHAQFQQAYLINCHSMPSRHSFARLPDIVLSDRNGVTCVPDFLHFVKTLFEQKGYKVALNHPYQGGEILRRYGQPTHNRHALQIEINRALYMNEESLKKKETDFKALKGDLRDITLELGKTLQQDAYTSLAAD